MFSGAVAAAEDIACKFALHVTRRRIPGNSCQVGVRMTPALPFEGTPAGGSIPKARSRLGAVYHRACVLHGPLETQSLVNLAEDILIKRVLSEDALDFRLGLLSEFPVMNEGSSVLLEAPQVVRDFAVLLAHLRLDRDGVRELVDVD